MKQFLKDNWFKISVAIIIFLIASNIFFIAKIQEFPIKYVICGKDYTDCFVSARFNDPTSCQNAVEKGGWYCDETNLDDIRCRAERQGESSATGYCTK